MELKVSEYEGKKLPRNRYTYEHLIDLQSRLMLVAGKDEQGKEHIDRFMQILDAVVILSNIYTKLVNGGCVFFTQWYVQILCDKSRAACFHINFGTGDNQVTLRGCLDSNIQDVSSIISKIGEYLEDCHSQWVHYIDQKRNKFQLLNFFTIDQIMILQQELAKVGSNEEPSSLIYPLLSDIKKGCTQENIIKAMAAAKQQIEQQNVQRQDINRTEESRQTNGNESETEKVQKFLDEISNLYSIELAREALKHHAPDEIDEAIIWCMENDDITLENAVRGENNSLPAQNEFTFIRWTDSERSLASIERERLSELGGSSSETSVESLLRDLQRLWEKFLTSISSSVADYLSVDHLGMILQKLAAEETNIVERKFPPSLRVGEPNLVICSQSEIYKTLLFLYIHEDDRPLPQSDEVLICSSRTTIDMVEIFWRRAVLSANKKVYCLANADLLNYDVSEKAEKTLGTWMKVAESKAIKYKLVVICSKENENKSRLVAVLDKYRQPELAVDTQAVKTFLRHRLIAETSGQYSAASFVDFEKSTVRVVKSSRAGVGKTLYKKRMVEKLDSIVQRRESHSNITIPLYETSINIDSVMTILLKETLPPENTEPRIFHIDIFNMVEDGVDAFLFQLLVLGCLSHSTGYVWRKLPQDYYIIESMDSSQPSPKIKPVHPCLDLLPYVLCRAPQDCLAIMTNPRRHKDYSSNDRLFDNKEFESPVFQRPFQYLRRFDARRKLNDVNSKMVEGNPRECLHILLKHCGITDPSWSEIHHFASFLNTQLEDFSNSVYCTLEIVRRDLPGFSEFVLRFLIQMSRDFATRSLKMSEESENDYTDDETSYAIVPYTMRKTWETSPHPYLFFNPDKTMTFLGFNVEKSTGNLIDLQSGRVLDARIMSTPLYHGLMSNRVRLDEDFDKLPRRDKIERIRRVMGISDYTTDPDPTYELTTDNVKKILAIYMRFRCDIPVIIMGETGCGKTRLIKFMCALQQPPGVEVKNLILMKVHGGAKVVDIRRKVAKAEARAKKNEKDYPFVDTILFFDEANTTEAIGAIKEIMCDKSIDGKPIELHRKLKIVAACNPYRKHSEELIKRLEQAGLGYHVEADKSSDKLGRVPMRHLVYRVQSLPHSMLPLVWDFGQLNTEVEELYIRQMVLRYIERGHLPNRPYLVIRISKILGVSQDFMRNQKDECSFVSLRDVERVLDVMSWFYQRMSGLLFEEIKRDETKHKIDDETRSLVLALGVCYHSCLKKREEFRETVAKHFKPPLNLPGGANRIKQEILNCQTNFLEKVKLTSNIAKNHALKENVFMMIVCIELRIPMFLVGKPGSSKSLAKTIVADAMQGNAAHTDFFKQFKETQMVSYQCSPLSVAEGITGTFRQCSAYQKGKDLQKFVSVVVLDEIGLAEDSPRMPLKALHPLLEDGCHDDEHPKPYKKVAFIGISNWALDPAKMNRGILVQREVPDIDELKESAEGICSLDEEVRKQMEPLFEPMAKSYLEVFEMASSKMREFFGLRDFYSLLKMLYTLIAESKDKPTWMQLKYCVLRNFGGLESVDPVVIFKRNLDKLVTYQRRKADPDCTVENMIERCLIGQESGSDRYLLLLIENYGVLLVLQQKILKIKDAVTIFGSSFPNDQEYTQVCRNINKIKVCMETGTTVILLNLENLYESLYDALNQYYVEFGGEKYVDLGLGSHRVKCRVDSKFRLIVVAEKNVVYDKFPIPLINRLEKHTVSLKTFLTSEQITFSEKLSEWARRFCQLKVKSCAHKSVTFKVGDSFMGYHDDTCPAIVQHCKDQLKNPKDEEEILASGKSMLLWCATPASVWCQDQDTFSEYFENQHHDSLVDYLHFKLYVEKKGNVYVQVTTHSKLLSLGDINELCEFLEIQVRNIRLLTLQSYDTEQQFIRQIRSCINNKSTDDMILIVQCDSGDKRSELIACARYDVQSELKQLPGIHVVFIIQLPSIAGGCFSGFQCGLWQSVHLDELQKPPNEMPSIADIRGKSISALLKTSTGVTQKRHFNIKYLIKRCMQRALSRIKEPIGTKSRATDRLNTVFQWLANEDEHNTLLSGIAKQLTYILDEKEESANSFTGWLSTEVSKSGNIIRAGTFRKFALNCIETKLMPMLTGIIASIDTNNNIDILAGDDEWKHDLWITMFNRPEFTQFRYETISFTTVEQRAEFNFIPVKFTSPEGKVFTSKMPFSWLIFQQVEIALKNVLDKRPKSKEIEVVTDISNLLTNVNLAFAGVMESDYELLRQAYLNDFVHMMYSVQSEEEAKLVGQSIDFGCSLLLGEQRYQLLPSLVGFHLAYMLQRTRLRNFCHAVQVCPTICQMITKYKQENPSCPLVKGDEITLDILALHSLILNLNPNKEMLKILESRTEWINKICNYRPIFEKMFGQFKENAEQRAFGYGSTCKAEIQKARGHWTRVLVVKLFIEHVCTSGKEDCNLESCMPMWKILEKEADMKTKAPLEKIEKILLLCNRRILKHYFGCQTECTHCKTLIDSAPVKLPCGHAICHKCYHDSKINDHQCPACRAVYPQNFDQGNCDMKREVKLYQDYRSRCNSFYMAVVTQLCFADGSPPSEELVEKFLTYIVGKAGKGKQGQIITKELTIFNDSIDSTPVVRSFLLQQLIQTSGDASHKYLEKCFKKIEELIKQGHAEMTGNQAINQNPFMTEFCLLVLHCKEDSLHQIDDNSSSEAVKVTKLLRECQTISTNMSRLTKIDIISKTKFSLTNVAKHLHRIIMNAKEQRLDIDIETKKMFNAASTLCNMFGNEWPGRYLVKQLCKYYGIDSFEAIKRSKIEWLQWVVLPELRETKIKECHDRCIVLGDEYLEIRDLITKTVISNDDKDLLSFLEKSAIAWRTRIKLLLALHREITMKYVYKEKTKQIQAESIDYICNLTSGCSIMKVQGNESNLDTIKRILHNKFWRVPGNIEKGMDLADQNLFCLLTHYFILLKELPGRKTLIWPLKMIAFSPNDMKKSFFPTMPVDQTAMFLEIVRSENRFSGHTGGELYVCPNGHPYILGDCGLPNGIHKCRDCGEQIGGTFHTLLPTNKKTERIREDKGHNLGDASKLDVPIPETKIQRTSFIILRLLTHMSMYIGTNTDSKVLCETITPKIREADVAIFVLSHIKHDLDCLHSVLEKSLDDVLALIHFLLANIMKEHTEALIGRTFPENVCFLTQKESREEWERHFDEQFILPVTRVMDEKLAYYNKATLDDKRLSSDPLLQIISEMHKEKETFSTEKLESNPAMWKYRSMITINQLHRNLETTGPETFPILKLFMKNEHHLRAIRFIPNIIKLQKLLIQKFSRSLFKADANKLTIGRVKHEYCQDPKTADFSSLVEDFKEAWNCVRHSLCSFGFMAGKMFKTIDKKHANMEITNETSIVYLIPTHKNEGLCSFGLLFFLLKTQNSFLENYCKLAKVRFGSLASVQLKDLSAAHLISYHPDKDLLPMIVANTDYSLIVGQETKLDYNFSNLERQIIDRFLFSKSEIKNIQEMETMLYRLEYTNGQILQSLQEKEKQERLSPALTNQISEDVKQKSYPDICDILDKLDIAISFILSISPDPNQSLYNFMTRTLQIENPFPCAKAHQSAKQKHIMSLWLTVAKERAKRSAKYKQEAFPGIPEEAKMPLTERQTEFLQVVLHKLASDHIEALMDLLFELIVLKIDTPQNVDDEDYIDIYNISLRDNLQAYIEACPFDGELNIDEAVVNAIQELPSNADNDNVRTANSVQVWILVYTAFSEKENKTR